jgi:thiosulfate reductase cytochrome b subunit
MKHDDHNPSFLVKPAFSLAGRGLGLKIAGSLRPGVAILGVGSRTFRYKHTLATRWFHWVNFPLLFVMIWSGLLIYWANDVYFIGWGDRVLFHFFPDGFYQKLNLVHRLYDGMAWHFLFMWLFAVNGLLYVSYTAISGEWRELVPNRASAKEAWQVVLHDLKIRKQPLPPRKFNGAQRISYTAVIVMGFFSLVTGIAIYKPVQLAWLIRLLGGYEWARAEHFELTLGYRLFFVVHILQVARAGWNNFRSMIVGYEAGPAAESESK